MMSSNNINENQNQNNKKPAYSFFLHISELNYNSKKAPNALQLERNYKDIKTFDIKNENIIGVDFSTSNKKIFFDNNQFKDNEVINKNIYNLIHAKSLNKNQNINQNIINKSMNNINTNNNKCMRQQNKKILAKKNPKKKRQSHKNQKKPKKSRNYSCNADFNMLSKKNKQKIQSKSSQISVSSAKSTKRNNILKTHNSPEKYPDDYWSVESSSVEEKELQKKEMEINQNSNSLLFKDLLETGKILDSDFNPKKKIEIQLEGFDIMSVDLKSVFRDTNFKKKYFKNIKTNIKIVYFDKESFPLQAIFIFDGEKFLNQKNKKLFPGAYSKDEFIEFCNDMINKDITQKVELLMDFSEMIRYPEIGFDENINLIDFYFLIDIIN